MYRVYYNIYLLTFRYTECRNGKGILKQCRKGLVFDEDIGFCDYPDIDVDPPSCVLKGKYNFTCPEIPVSQKHALIKHNCVTFFICFSEGEPKESSCQEPLAFDEKVDTCVPFQEVKGCENLYDSPSIYN